MEAFEVRKVTPPPPSPFPMIALQSMLIQLSPFYSKVFVRPTASFFGQVSSFLLSIAQTSGCLETTSHTFFISLLLKTLPYIVLQLFF